MAWGDRGQAAQGGRTGGMGRMAVLAAEFKFLSAVLGVVFNNSYDTTTAGSWLSRHALLVNTLALLLTIEFAASHWQEHNTSQVWVFEQGPHGRISCHARLLPLALPHLLQHCGGQRSRCGDLRIGTQS